MLCRQINARQKPRFIGHQKLRYPRHHSRIKMHFPKLKEKKCKNWVVEKQTTVEKKIDERKKLRHA